MHKILQIITIVILVGITGLVIVNIKIDKDPGLKSNKIEVKTPIPTPQSTYYPQPIKRSDSYTIIFVGDSMTDVLGENMDYLREELTNYYPNKIFGLFNYGFGGSNILSVQTRLKEETEYRGKKFEPIIERVFDVFVLESMGHNPLSEYSLEEGLKRQQMELEKIVSLIHEHEPNANIIFLATIAPHRTLYAQNIVELSQEQRDAWVAERKAYIENHIKFAREHNIALINVYEKSFDEGGEVKEELISKNDYIHPSSTGAQFISSEIAKYLFENNILPQ